MSIKRRLDLEITKNLEQVKSTELQKIAFLMKEVKTLAEKTKNKKNRQNACVMVDPNTAKVVAKASDSTGGDDRSIDHSVMNLLKVFSQAARASSDLLGKREPLDEVEEGYYLCKGMHVYLWQEPCSPVVIRHNVLNGSAAFQN